LLTSWATACGILLNNFEHLQQLISGVASSLAPDSDCGAVCILFLSEQVQMIVTSKPASYNCTKILFVNNRFPKHASFFHPLGSYFCDLLLQTFTAWVPLEQVHHLFQRSFAFADVTHE
jgi:hypothetical protein